MHHLFTKKRLITFAISCFALFIFSFILAFVIVPAVINSQIDKNVRLERGTDQWHRFKELPFNITFNVSLFEVTNAEDVITLGAKPNLIERGPYVFDEVLRKYNIVYNEENDTISYERKAEFYFNQEKSGPDLDYDDDTITMINPAYITILQMVESNPLMNIPLVPGAVQSCLEEMFPTGILLHNTHIKELIFDGFKVCDFNNIKCKFPFPICDQFRGKSKTIEEVGDVTAPDHYMKFSFLNYKTREPDGVYEIKTGIEDINDVGSITHWNYNKYTNYWMTSLLNNSCNEVKGTDGTIFPPHLNEDSKLTVYSTDICRYAEAEYSGTGSYSGIDGYRYKASPKLYYSSTSDPKDDCFCVQSTLNAQGQPSCFLDGVMDFSPCIGAAVLLSYPHFLYADPKYLEGLTGDLSPNPKEHELYVLLDKYVGIPLQAHKRAQMNIILRPIKHFKKLTGKLPRTILPLIWLDEGVDLPDIGLDLINNLFYNTFRLVNILKWVFIGVTLGLTVMACVLLWRHLYSP